MTIEVLLNGEAGPGGPDAMAQAIVEACATHQVTARVTRASRGADLVALTKSLRARACDAVVAAGGDGTVSAVASVLAGTETPLGVIPLGTLNHFARDLKIPVDLEAAVKVIAAGSAASVDVGEAGGRTFINNASLGLYPQFVTARDASRQRGRGKWIAGLVAAISVLRHYSFVKVRLVVDGRAIVRRTLIVFVGNNTYEMQSLAVGTRASLTEGTLSLLVTPFELMTAREIVLQMRRSRVRVAIDGEVVTLPTPVKCRIRPGALRVLVP